MLCPNNCCWLWCVPKTVADFDALFWNSNYYHVRNFNFPCFSRPVQFIWYFPYPAGKHSPDICSGTSFFMPSNEKLRCAQKGLVICTPCPLLIFLSWMAIWAGLSTASANSFIMPQAGEDLFCRRWVIYELYRTSTPLLCSNLGKLVLSWGQQVFSRVRYSWHLEKH